MPYRMRKQGDKKYCIFNSETGENKGCSDTEKMAAAHMRALYSHSDDKKELAEIETEFLSAIADYEKESETPFDPVVLKEIIDASPEDLEKMSLLADAYIPWAPAKSYSELEEQESARERLSKALKLIAQFPDMARELIFDPETPQKAAAIEDLASQLADRLDKLETQPAAIEEDGYGENKETPRKKHKSIQENLEEAVIAVLKSVGLYKEAPADGLMVWKDTDSGQYRWFARYSTNFRDNDNPPEIISEQSHRLFVDKVEKGLAPFPELWIWHGKSLRIGRSAWVGYDDAGFAMSAGAFLPGCEDAADFLAHQKDVALSHGMPVSTIRRDPSDPTIIIEHETREISVLPRYAAANKLTSFHALKEEANMAIPTEQRKKLINWGLPEDVIAKVEGVNLTIADKAVEAGVEHKENKDAVPPDAVAAPVVTETIETTGSIDHIIPEAETVPDELPPSRREVAETLATILTEQTKVIEALAIQTKEMNARVEALEISNKEAASNRFTPLASIMTSLGLDKQSPIGAAGAEVKPDDPLANQKPKEAADGNAGKIGIPFIDQMLVG